MNALARFSEIARVSFPWNTRPGVMLMLAAYFDDSGTHDASRVVVWGGFLGTCEQWSALDQAWRAKLERPLVGRPRLSKFSVSDCQACRNEFEGYGRAESDLLQNEMREIIVSAGVIGIAYAVEKEPWDRLANDAAKRFFGDVETVCFSACFNGAIERAENVYPNDRMLSLHFDRGRKSPKLDAIVDRVTTNYTGSPALVNISFNRVVDFTPLQAADVIAGENYWHANGVVDGQPDPRPHFRHFLSRVQANGYILQEPEVRNTLRLYGFTPSPVAS